MIDDSAGRMGARRLPVARRGDYRRHRDDARRGRSSHGGVYADLDVMARRSLTRTVNAGLSVKGKVADLVERTSQQLERVQCDEYGLRKYAIALIVIFVILILGGTAAASAPPPSTPNRL